MIFLSLPEKLVKEQASAKTDLQLAVNWLIQLSGVVGLYRKQRPLYVCITAIRFHV